MFTRVTPTGEPKQRIDLDEVKKVLGEIQTEKDEFRRHPPITDLWQRPSMEPLNQPTYKPGPIICSSAATTDAKTGHIIHTNHEDYPEYKDELPGS